MAEANKLDEPLNDVDYDELEVFLGSNAVPQDCMDLEMLDGFLTAVVSGPELIQPSEWLPVVWSDSQRTVTPGSPLPGWFASRHRSTKPGTSGS